MRQTIVGTSHGDMTDADEFKRCVKAWAEKIGVQPRVVTLRPINARGDRAPPKGD